MNNKSAKTKYDYSNTFDIFWWLSLILFCIFIVGRITPPYRTSILFNSFFGWSAFVSFCIMIIVGLMNREKGDNDE